MKEQLPTAGQRALRAARALLSAGLVLNYKEQEQFAIQHGTNRTTMQRAVQLLKKGNKEEIYQVEFRRKPLNVALRPRPEKKWVDGRGNNRGASQSKQVERALNTLEVATGHLENCLDSLDPGLVLRLRKVRETMSRIINKTKGTNHDQAQLQDRVDSAEPTAPAPEDPTGF